jgi:hypothetical protein
LAPASASRRVAMIFSSVNLDFFIRVLLGGKLYFLPVRDFEGATTGPCTDATPGVDGAALMERSKRQCGTCEAR